MKSSPMTDPSRGERIGVALAVAAASLWGTLGIAYRLGVEYGASLSWLIAGRPLLAGILSLVIALARGARPSKWSLLIAFLGLAPLYTVYPLAVSEVGAALASVLLYTAPSWVALAGPLVLGERLSAGRLAVVATGIAGVALVSIPGGEARVTAWGLLLGLASGVSYAAYMILARLAQLRGAGREEVSLYPIAISAPLVLAAARPTGLPGPVDAVFAVYLAVACTIAPYLLHTKALQLAEASRVAVVSLVEPLTAVLLAALLLGESLSPAQLAGASLIIASAYAASKW